MFYYVLYVFIEFHKNFKTLRSLSKISTIRNGWAGLGWTVAGRGCGWRCLADCGLTVGWSTPWRGLSAWLAVAAGPVKMVNTSSCNASSLPKLPNMSHVFHYLYWTNTETPHNIS